MQSGTYLYKSLTKVEGLERRGSRDVTIERLKAVAKCCNGGSGATRVSSLFREPLDFQG